MTSAAVQVDTIEIIAHRGASADLPEHTLAAYERAIDQGADALECDVRLTADGHLVCVHDRRINRVSDGRGSISTKTLAELDERDFASWHVDTHTTFDGDPVVIDEESRRVLTLDRLVRLVKASPRQVGLAIEAKHPTRYAGLVEERIAQTLQVHGLTALEHHGWVRVMSFSQLSLRRMRSLAPYTPRVLLMDRVPLRFRDGSLPYRTTIAGPSIEILRAHPGYVRRAHAVGHDVHVWTVDEPADFALCRDLGVDAVITNRPALALDLLR